MKNNADSKLLQKCLLQIEEKLAWGPSDSWHNDVFNELSEQIQAETNVVLSPTTLKRVWGRVSYKSSPSISTLNTLAQFIGYTNWREFRTDTQQLKPTGLSRQTIFKRGAVLIAAAFMTLVFISLYSMVDLGNNRQPIVPVDFTSRPITQGLPNTVVFDLDLHGNMSDSIYIQQYWDPNKTIKIKPGQSQATGIYYYPGYFRAKLLIDGQIEKEHDLYLESDGWLGTINYEPIPKYVNVSNFPGGKLALPISIASELKSNESPIESSYHLVQDFGPVPGDNIRLKTSIRNTYHDKWAICQTVRIVILGTKGALIIPFSIPGCVSEIGLMLNDIYLSGKEHDLSAFGAELSAFTEIEVLLRNKKVEVFREGINVFSGSYNESIGRLVGFRYRFLGIGEVDYLEVSDSNNEIILEENFD